MKFIYKNCKLLYFAIIHIKMSYLIIIGQKNKAKIMITEHFKYYE